MKKFLGKSILACAALAAMLAGAERANADLITNGSFETGINPGGFTTINAGDSTSITGWTVTGGSVDYIGTYWQASDGVRSLDMSGNQSGTIAQQNLATTIGQQYAVTFDISGNPDGAPPIKNLLVTAGATSQSFSFDASGNSRTNMGWLGKSMSFFATSTSTLLTFDSQTSGPYGPALDNVHVNAVPEPTSLALLGLGALGSAIGAYRRRKTAV